jgi:hypothetical protein
MTLKEALDEYYKQMIPRAAQEVIVGRGMRLAVLLDPAINEFPEVVMTPEKEVVVKEQA